MPSTNVKASQPASTPSWESRTRYHRNTCVSECTSYPYKIQHNFIHSFMKLNVCHIRTNKKLHQRLIFSFFQITIHSYNRPHIHSQTPRVVWPVGCTVASRVYCGQWGVLWPVECTVASGVYCGQWCVLWPVGCTVASGVYCGLWGVLWPVACTVGTVVSGVYCGQWGVLWPVGCTVASGVYCGQWGVLWPVACTVGNVASDVHCG